MVVSASLSESNENLLLPTFIVLQSDRRYRHESEEGLLGLIVVYGKRRRKRGPTNALSALLAPSSSLPERTETSFFFLR